MALATFTQSPATASIISGIESDWTLPDIDSGNVALTEVRLDTDSLILKHLEYDSVANKIRYDGEEINALKAMKLVTLNITLVNSVGEAPYSQLVIVSPNQDSLLSLEPEGQNAAEEIEEAADEVAVEISGSAPKGSPSKSTTQSEDK